MLHRKFITTVIFLLSLAAPMVAQAASPAKQAQETVDPWHGSNVQAGVIINSGNTDSTSVNVGTTLKYKMHRLKNTFQANFDYGSSHGVKNQSQYFIQDEINYDLTHQHAKRHRFAFFSANLNVDEFSAYHYQSVSAIGYGQDLIKSNDFELSAQLGPGYRRDKARETNQVRNSFVLSTQSQLTWHLARKTDFTQSLRYDMSHVFNYLRSVTAITTKLVHHLSLQASLTVEHYSKLPLSTMTSFKKTDTTTMLSLMYHF